MSVNPNRHPAKKGEMIPLATGSGVERNRLDQTNRALRIVNPQLDGYDEHKAKSDRGFAGRPRLQYSAMRTHMEMAAQALAAGSTKKMAAKYAGVSQRQVSKYFTDPDFRTRIDELRATLTSRIHGKLLKELNRRTTGKMLRSMDLLDMLRVFDRVTTGGKGMKLQVGGDVNINNYDTILNALFNSDAGSDGEDFPVYEPGSVPIPGRDSPID